MEEIVTYPAALLAGFISFVSPCVLPVIPGYLSFISGVSMEEMQSRENRGAVTRKVAINSLFFVLGFSLVFILLGWTASSVGRFLLSYLHIFNKIAEGCDKPLPGQS